MPLWEIRWPQRKINIRLSSHRWWYPCSDNAVSRHCYLRRSLHQCVRPSSQQNRWRAHLTSTSSLPYPNPEVIPGTASQQIRWYKRSRSSLWSYQAFQRNLFCFPRKDTELFRLNRLCQTVHLCWRYWCHQHMLWY